MDRCLSPESVRDYFSEFPDSAHFRFVAPTYGGCNMFKRFLLERYFVYNVLRLANTECQKETR